MSTVQNEVAKINPEQTLFNQIETGLKARFGFSQWDLSTIYIFLAFWIKTILLKMTDNQEYQRMPVFGIKKIGRTKYAGYQHSYSDDGKLGKLFFNARYLNPAPSNNSRVSYIVTMAVEVARCIALREKQAVAKSKASIKEINEVLARIGLKYLGNKKPAQEAYELSINGWLKNELKKAFGDAVDHIEYSEFDPKPEKKISGQQVTIENSVATNQVQVTISSDDTIREEISTLKQNLSDLEAEYTSSEADVKILQKQNNDLSKKLEEATKCFEEEKQALLAQLNLAPAPVVAPAPAPAPVVETEKTSVFAKIKKLVFDVKPVEKRPWEIYEIPTNLVAFASKIREQKVYHYENGIRKACMAWEKIQQLLSAAPMEYNNFLKLLRTYCTDQHFLNFDHVYLIKILGKMELVKITTKRGVKTIQLVKQTEPTPQPAVEPTPQPVAPDNTKSSFEQRNTMLLAEAQSLLKSGAMPTQAVCEHLVQYATENNLSALNMTANIERWIAYQELAYAEEGMVKLAK